MAMSASYPTPTVVFPTAGPRPASANSAETMVLIALILQVIGGLILFVAFAALIGVSLAHPFAYAWVAISVVAAIAIVVFVFLYFAYTLCYERIRRGDYVGAQTPTLVIGILSVFAGVIPGIFYLIGYAKLGDAIREQQAPVPGYGLPAVASPGPALVACKNCGRVHHMGAFAFCPSCGQKLGA